ncbi:hypothetical protein [Paracoccus albus]|uniref:hypothetical protein n=1 Tax=Paracoccus albus TaxID=3017784 RepID=UPI0022F11371|nr:hypothetical protein [Paracoccus albus]WBU60763.1 hypothetical protein PAF20_02220 [Paracoccus albus]
MHVIVHAGSLKTGSTYLQSVILRNRLKLSEEGVLVPSTGIVSEHHYDIARAAGFGFAGQKLSDETGREILQALSDELASSPHQAALLSSEHFDLGVEAGAIRRLREALADHEVSLAIFLRNQVDLVQSLYFEHLKWGGLNEYNRFVLHKVREGALWYEERIALWKDGGFKVNVFDYQAERGDLAGRLFSLLPQPPSLANLSLPSVPRNESLSPEAMEYMRKINLTIADAADRREFYVGLYKTLHQNGPRWVRSRQMPLPESLHALLPELTKRNRRLAEMLGEGEGFLQGDLVDYAAQREQGDALDMEGFLSDIKHMNLPIPEGVM